MSGPAPFGMRRIDGGLVADPSAAGIVQELVEAFIAAGGRFKATARVLNGKGLHTRSGASWSDTSVARVLLSPSLPRLIPTGLWQRCEPLLHARADQGRFPARRPEHPLGAVVLCRCGGRMYLRAAGPAAKFVCRSCRAKIRQDTLETLFCKALESISIEATMIVEAVGDAPRSGELTRILGGRGVVLSEIWAELDRNQKRQLSDLLLDHVEVGPADVSVICRKSVGFPPNPAPTNSVPLPSSHGSEESSARATRRGQGLRSDDLGDLLTIDEVAALLRTTPKAVYSMIDRGQLPGVARIGRRLRIRRNDLLGFLEASRVSSQKERRP